jgi:hypothetical protein
VSEKYAVMVNLWWWWWWWWSWLGERGVRRRRRINDKLRFLNN